MCVGCFMARMEATLEVHQKLNDLTPFNHTLVTNTIAALSLRLENM